MKVLKHLLWRVLDLYLDRRHPVMATGVVEVRWSQEQEGESSSAQARDCVRNEAGRKVGNDVDYEVTNVDVE